jgi:CHAD domain-containing protein
MAACAGVRRPALARRKSCPRPGFTANGDLTGSPPRPGNLMQASPQLSPQACAGEAFQAIARHCLRQFIVNKAAVLVGNAEALHGMRIALRRLRTALRVFSAVVGNHYPVGFKRELRWIARELGPAREVDVFVADVVAPLRRRYSRNREVMRVSHDFERRRASLYGQVAVALRSSRLSRLESQLKHWLEAGRWLASRSGSAARARDRPMARLAAKALDRRQHKIRRLGRRLATLDRAHRHRLRIHAKKLRYTIEFFAELFPGRKRAKRCRKMLTALEELQDSLGALNDLAGRNAIAGRGMLIESAAVSKWLAAQMSPESQKARVVQLLRHARHACRRVCATEPFWE